MKRSVPEGNHLSPDATVSEYSRRPCPNLVTAANGHLPCRGRTSFNTHKSKSISVVDLVRERNSSLVAST